MENKPLGDDWYFRLSIIIPLVTSFIAFSLIFINGSYAWNFSAIGFNSFYDTFKVPIWIAGLSLPISGLYAAIHRSAQTHAQIQVMHAQNIFTNHFTHREEFSKFYEDELKSVNTLPKRPAVEIHDFIFPNTIKGSFSVNPKFIECRKELSTRLSHMDTLEDYSIDSRLLLRDSISYIRDTLKVNHLINKDNLSILEFLYFIDRSCKLFSEEAVFMEVVTKLHSIQKKIDKINTTLNHSFTPLHHRILDMINRQTIDFGNSETQDLTETQVKDIIIHILIHQNQSQIELLLNEILSYDHVAYEKLISYVKECVAACHNKGIETTNLLYILDL